MKQGFALTALDYKGGQIVMGFDAPGGAADAKLRRGDPRSAIHQAAASARVWRVCSLGPEKLKCIRELGMGQNAKIMNGTTSRVWRSPDSGLPAPSNGSFYSDLGFQNSVGDKPRPAGRGAASSPTSWAQSRP